jgi:glucose-1-phosphate cytidylyltransferase
MKVVIFAGGFGTRLGDITKKIPKPMIKIISKPIIYYIIKHYYKYNFKKFLILTGYKHKILENYLKSIKLKGAVIKTFYTGLNTMTGGRLKRISNQFYKNEVFHLTYGDAICDVNLEELTKKYLTKKKSVQVLAVNPTTKYGELKIKRNLVIGFEEKPKFKNIWINAGFFILNTEIFKYLKNDKTVLEKEPLEELAKKKKMSSFKFNGFWKCVDTQRDLKELRSELKKLPSKFF